jgi:RNA polymerase sigma-70 factor (ECF subfamily)
MEALTTSSPTTYCLVPPDLATELHDLLRAHYRRNPSVVVVVDRRWPRLAPPNGDPMGDGDTFVDVEDPPPLPFRVRRHAERIRFVRHAESEIRPPVEDRETARLVERAKAGDPDAFAALYVRHFDRIYAYLRLNLRDRHEAEDLAQQVFLNALDHLDQLERAFRPWLFRIARNLLLNHLKRSRPMLTEDPEQLSDGAGAVAEDVDALRSRLSLMSDSEVAMLIDRLPVAQQQVLILRHLVGLKYDEIAEVLDRTPKAVHHLDYRAREHLRVRLTALGRAPEVKRRAAWLLRRPRAAPVLRERRFALLRR